MLPDEPESAVPNLHRGQEVSKVHPTVRVHLEAVPLREVSQDAGHRAAEEFDLLVVEEELAFAAAVRAELFPEIAVRTTFLEHASPPLGGWYSPTAYEPSSSCAVGRSASRTMRRPNFSRRSSNARTSGFARLLRCTYAIVAPSVRNPLRAAVIHRGADGTSVSGCPPNSAPRGLPIGWTVRLGRRLSERCFDR